MHFILSLVLIRQKLYFSFQRKPRFLYQQEIIQVEQMMIYFFNWFCKNNLNICFDCQKQSSELIFKQYNFSFKYPDFILNKSMFWHSVKSILFSIPTCTTCSEYPNKGFRYLHWISNSQTIFYEYSPFRKPRRVVYEITYSHIQKRNDLDNKNIEKYCRKLPKENYLLYPHLEFIMRCFK